MMPLIRLFIIKQKKTVILLSYNINNIDNHCGISFLLIDVDVDYLIKLHLDYPPAALDTDTDTDADKLWLSCVSQ